MPELNKRYSAKHKAALGRVSEHLTMAKTAHERGMSSLADCAKCLVEANKIGKAADGDRFASALASAYGNFGKAASSIGDAQAHLNQALSHFSPEEVPLLVPRGYSASPSNSNAPIPSLAGAVTPSLDDMTEGDVPQYDSVAPYGEKIAAAFANYDAKAAAAAESAKMKVAGATTFAKMFTGQTLGRYVIGRPRLWRH